MSSPLEARSDAAAAASSAARRALGLFELISVILTHVQPADCCAYTEADDGSDAIRHYPGSQSAAARQAAAARATLRAAILVNRTWFMAGVPLLWRCLSGDAALGCPSVAEPTRRAFYASQVRHVTVAGRGALWRSLAHGACSGADGAAGCAGSAGGSAVARHAITVALPCLTSLRVALRWSRASASEPSNNPAETMRRNLAGLAAYVSPRLEELSCYLTADLLDRLSALLGRLEANDEAVVPAVVKHTLRHEHELTKPGGTRLRKLNLYQSWWEPWNASTGIRLLAWLAQPGSTPLLVSAKLCEVMSGSMASLADDAFRHFALRNHLEQLWLGKYPHYMHMTVSKAAINDIVALGRRDVGNAEYRYCDGGFRLVSPARSNWRPPFEQLRDLLVAVECEQSVTLLAPFLVSLTHLSLRVGQNTARDVSDEEILRSLSVLKGLQNLQLLLAGRSPFTDAGLVHLQSLTQLQELTLDSQQPSRFSNTHMESLLASVRHLRLLSLHIDMRKSWHQVVRVIGENCPGLRCFFLRSASPANLATIFESRFHAPLFPRLEFLGLPCAEACPDYSRSKAEKKDEAEREAQLLLYHAPQLQRLQPTGRSGYILSHLMHRTLERASPLRLRSAKDEALLKRLVQCCELCQI